MLSNIWKASAALVTHCYTCKGFRVQGLGFSTIHANLERAIINDATRTAIHAIRPHQHQQEAPQQEHPAAMESSSRNDGYGSDDE